MFSPAKNCVSAMKRMLNRRLAAGVWIMSLLALFTLGHLALLRVERTRDLKAIDYQNSTIERLFQKLMISDRALCGEACASENANIISEEAPVPERDEGVSAPHEELPVGGAEEVESLLPERAAVMHPEQYHKDVAKKWSSHWTEEVSTAQEQLFQKRSSSVQDICHSMKLTGALSPIMKQVLVNLRYMSKNNMIWCPVFKAASTTWVKYLLMMAGETRITEKSLHARVRQLYGQPKDPKIRDKFIREFQKMLIVRHPLERLLSAYRDKMLRVRSAHDPHVRLQQEIMRLFPDPNSSSPVTTRPTKGGKKKAELPTTHPTFTQFLMKVRDDLQKTWSSDAKFIVNMHWRPVWLTCAPCHIPYDFIAKVETLDLEQEYIIRQMGLQDLLYNAQTHSSNFDSYNTTSDAAKEYFKHVPRPLLRDVVELYQPDFTLFDYSPDLYLNMAKSDQ